MNPRAYSYRDAGHDSAFIAEVSRLTPWRTYRALALAWLSLVGLVLGMRALPAPWFWYLYPVAAFLIAGRFGALLQVVHEGAHGLIHPSKRINDRVSRWLAARPIGITHEGYAQGHYRHHAYTGTERDPESDREKYRVTNVRDPRLYGLLLKDLCGWSALRVFFAYRGNDGGAPHVTLAALGLVQAVILAALFSFDVFAYGVLWLYPAMGPHMVLMRIRGIGEHGLYSQLGLGVVTGNVHEGTYYTRSSGTPARVYACRPLVWLERALIGSLSVYYHHEHHLYPRVPFYHLARVHERIAPAVRALNPDVYVRGYFTGFLKNAMARP